MQPPASVIRSVHSWRCSGSVGAARAHGRPIAGRQRTARHAARFHYSQYHSHAMLRILNPVSAALLRCCIPRAAAARLIPLCLRGSITAASSGATRRCRRTVFIGAVLQMQRRMAHRAGSSHFSRFLPTIDRWQHTSLKWRLLACFGQSHRTGAEGVGVAAEPAANNSCGVAAGRQQPVPLYTALSWQFHAQGFEGCFVLPLFVHRVPVSCV